MPTPDDNYSKSEAFEDRNLPLDTAPMLPLALQKLDEIRDILERMLLLAEASADPAVEDAERAALQKQLDRLRGEIDAIAAESGWLYER